MKIIDFSDKSAQLDSVNPDEIHIFTQFFIHKDIERNDEIQKCLLHNVNNSLITKIHLLNERIYTDAELGIVSSKIIQTNINSLHLPSTRTSYRLRFKDVFEYIRENAIIGYHVLVNADIFFDETLLNLQRSEIHLKKAMFAQLRYEYNGSTDLNQSVIFGPRFDSQDTWIFHSNFSIPYHAEKIFNFEFGKPGCDNKFLYLMKILNYQIINDPKCIKTYHFHRSQTRNYTNRDVIPMPWAVSVPYGFPMNTIAPSLGIDLKAVSAKTNHFKELQFEDNKKIHDYILSKFSQNQHFILPRISGIENNFAVFARIARGQITIPADIMNYFQNVAPAMKNNAGIKMTTMNSIMKYSDLYLKAFENCEMYCGWEPQGNYIGHISQSHDYMRDAYSGKQIVMSFALDVFHYIYNNPWTLALKGKRVLVISAFESSIRERIPYREKIYGIDLFPDCEITTIKPPQTHASENSREFDIELADFCKRLDQIKDTYDIALVSCGGYGNLVCNHIFESGRSAIYVGGTLQMLFGLLGSRWLKERPDVVRLFLNTHWARPKVAERPIGYQNIEGGCYF